ncbi:MAG: sugar phosphate isomerase/epimerase [Saprospiraceae bacterium]|nr:sugar phosphate isomerase/epimerase [Saprospiraceae bacterium]
MNHNFSRRQFLKNTSLAAAGTVLAPQHLLNALSFPPIQHLGVQLWSIREDMGKDTPGTVKALANMGYREVEGFGYSDGKMFGMPIADFSKLLKDNGISMPSSHVMFTSKSFDAASKSLTDSAKKAIDDAAAIGQKYVVCPYMIDEDRAAVADMVKVFAAAGEYAKKAGLRFGYHNHDFEFTKRGPDNRLIVEWLLHEVDPKLMAMEMDIYWVAFAHHNPLDWINLYPGRWELCHAKDMAKTEKRESIEVGDGSIDFTAIFKQSQKAGLKYYIVELENYVTTPLEGVKRARQNLLKLKF